MTRFGSGVAMAAMVMAAMTAGAGAAQAQIACESLKGLQLPDVTISSAVGSTTATTRGGPAVPMCTVNGVIGREIKFSVAMPDAWNGKFTMGGQGNIAGTVGDMAAQMYNSVGLGYASAGTDTGHEQGERNAPPLWAMDPFLGPERQVNFFHSAIHRVTVTSKAIVAARYGRTPEKSYFAGCSNGGREGLMEVQRYPDDFDAALVSAPAYNLSQLLLPRVVTGRMVFPDAKNWNKRNLDNKDRMVLAKAVLDACDAQDGLKDGILSDPESCKFDPGVLQCKGGKKDTCLSKAGVDVVRSWWGGVKDAKGKPLTPGFARGGEGENLWQQNLTGADENPGKGSYAPNSGILRAIDYLAYFLSQPDWDYTKATIPQLQADLKKLESTNSDNPDLSAFRKHGGKLLMNHGWTDATISAKGTVAYTESVYAHDAAAKNDVRLFLVAGMGHCGGGPGPQRVDWLTTLDKWVATGKAPEELETGFATGGGARKLCAFPKKAVYKGTGDGKSPEQFECR
ncbi:MAG: tannase/feruloyl esterase family alpha/beta hydrolase [Alphaproteobacteria bacterium]